jgi:hypothetical protein
VLDGHFLSDSMESKTGEEKKTKRSQVREALSAPNLGTKRYHTDSRQYHSSASHGRLGHSLCISRELALRAGFSRIAAYRPLSGLNNRAGMVRRFVRHCRDIRVMGEGLAAHF